MKFHKNLDLERWSAFKREKQILMIANELNRAINWLEKGDLKEVKKSYERAFELLDLTIAVTRERNRLKELLRFREMLANLYVRGKRKETYHKELLKILLTLDSKAYKVLEMNG
jgi:pantothenate kinase